MLTYPHIDPIIFQIGPLALRWYGLMYLLGFMIALGLMRYRAKQQGEFTSRQVDDLLFYGVVGVVIGGRVGHVLFYSFQDWLADPLYLFKIWEGGMSFHGGLLGVLVAMALLARQWRCNYFAVTDFLAPAVPPGLMLGRLGNFINGELWGKPTSVPWGFNVNGVTRHPSQLYEALFEGVLLFVVIWLYSATPRPLRRISALFLMGYGSARFMVEFVRLPDAHVGYLAWGWFTMGQLLSLPMIVLGAWLWWRSSKGDHADAKT